MNDPKNSSTELWVSLPQNFCATEFRDDIDAQRPRRVAERLSYEAPELMETIMQIRNYSKVTFGCGTAGCKAELVAKTVDGRIEVVKITKPDSCKF